MVVAVRHGNVVIAVLVDAVGCRWVLICSFHRICQCKSKEKKKKEGNQSTFAMIKGGEGGGNVSLIKAYFYT